MSNLIKRTITGILFVAVLVGGILWSFYSFFILFLLITILSVWEFYTLAGNTGHTPQKIVGVVGSIITFSVISLIGYTIIDAKFLLLIPAFFTLVFAIELFRKKPNPYGNTSFTVLGILYIAVPFSLLSFLPGFSVHYNTGLILGFFILIWISDTGAFCAGKLFGKHKLLERVSPGKTWEGFIGGAIFTLGGAFVLSQFYYEFTLTNWIITALIITIFGTIGDLSESLFKRSINVKDSGSILPGHGGMLDRFDAALLASPPVVAYLYLAS